MPITDYSKTIIYKIVCSDLNVNECYVGHTTDMTKRKCQHKSCCHNEKDKGHNHKIYKIIRENGGWSNWSMILVEKFPCKDKFEACKREREIFEELGAKMNIQRPYITQEDTKEYYKQYYQDHKEEYIQNRKQYYQDHKEEIEQYQKKYHEDHKEELKQNQKKYYQDHKEQIKQYRENHKEQIEQYQKKYNEQYGKKYREENKEKRNKKIECDFCKKRLSNRYMPCHIKICKSKE